MIYRIIFSLLLFMPVAAFAGARPQPPETDMPVAVPVYAGITAPVAVDVSTLHEPVEPISHTPLVSINTDVLDMNWTGSMELTDPQFRPTGITLPMLESYPIDNIEVKLRVLNMLF